jgi:hypothetical protein
MGAKMAEPAYSYDPRSRQYRSSTGRVVDEKAVRGAVDVVIDAETLTMRRHAQDYSDGRINFSEWQLRSLATLKSLHVAVALAGNGGRESTSPSDLSVIGNLVKTQYHFFRSMVAEIRQGKQQIDNAFLARVELYGQAARATHEAMRLRAARNAGAQESCRVLGAADHCAGCLQEAAKSWGPLGHNVPIGSVECKVRCRCHVEYR